LGIAVGMPKLSSNNPWQLNASSRDSLDFRRKNGGSAHYAGTSSDQLSKDGAGRSSWRNHIFLSVLLKGTIKSSHKFSKKSTSENALATRYCPIRESKQGSTTPGHPYHKSYRPLELERTSGE
jgi:hypothetical protein